MPTHALGLTPQLDSLVTQEWFRKLTGKFVTPIARDARAHHLASPVDGTAGQERVKLRHRIYL
jgi:hypothetical protein